MSLEELDDVSDVSAVGFAALDNLEEENVDLGQAAVSAVAQAALRELETPTNSHFFEEEKHALPITAPAGRDLPIFADLSGIDTSDKPLPCPLSIEIKTPEPNPTKEYLEAYVSLDAKINREGQELIKKGEMHFRDLHHLKEIWKKIQDFGPDDLPDEHTFAEELEESFKVAERLGLIEVDQRSFTKKEIKIFSAKLTTEMEILPQKGNNEFSKAGKKLDLLNIVLKAASETMREDARLKERIVQRSGQR